MPVLSDIAVIELPYLPNIQFFSKLMLYQQVFLEQHENYRKSSYRNRCYIAGPNGQHRLSIPLKKGKNEQQNIQQVEIAFNEPWPHQHWQAIQSAYGNAPFFEFYVDYFQPIFEQPDESLFAFNQRLFNTLLKVIPVTAKIEYTSEYHEEWPSDADDLRHFMLPKKMGREADDFYQAAPYPQVFQEKHGFLANLSILDLLFCTGPQTVQYLEKSILHTK